MILRFRSKEGTFRVNTEPTSDFELVLKSLVSNLADVAPMTLSLSNVPNDKGQPAAQLCGKTVQELGLKHGDLLFFTIESTATSPDSGSSDTKVLPSVEDGIDSAMTVFKNTKQLPVDDFLEAKDGKIIRGFDSRMCQHGSKGMCDYCMPLEPWDAGYHELNAIKHTSFHAYLRKINSTANKTGSSSSYIAPLSQANYEVDRKCTNGHLPWPAGICSKCQPSAITLQQQSFRMVDHVEFASPSIINSFIDSWRQTGTQRIGYLYGRYEAYDMVPLGTKAVVEAIYEPPQHDEADGVTLTIPWDEEKNVDNMAQLCGLQRVGVVYSDLTDAGKGDGSVICKRHVDSYFLSSLEIVFAAQLQVANPNPCRWATSGIYSSKFVTCVITGNTKGEIDIVSYQVSETAEAMVKADLIEPSINPSLMLINEPTTTRYVPDIFYKRINEYKRAVQENAKPAFPVEYLLITLTHGFPSNANPMFDQDSKFPLANRQALGTSQDLHGLSQVLGLEKGTFSISPETITKLSNFHVINYIHSLGILNKDEEQLLAKLASQHESVDGYRLYESNGWQTLLTIIREST
ncbi:nuclear protein localization protein 4 [Nadsonia fulvescens var. elongata DSM 6958]|uniref:Nuclear protein localization protein 4 n=1 Tax=Nadsonia fulvescens var. elongata DSM 6958 TaxID=857566 RepID=A0A1E3PHA8_9ASCO|nr:nuclear protein localization protein 4 [Nadsonia fulvescens var. elongata DSM 6958]